MTPAAPSPCACPAGPALPRPACALVRAVLPRPATGPAYHCIATPVLPARCSTNTIGAVARIRNALAYATHRFFQVCSQRTTPAPRPCRCRRRCRHHRWPGTATLRGLRAGSPTRTVQPARMRLAAAMHPFSNEHAQTSKQARVCPLPVPAGARLPVRAHPHRYRVRLRGRGRDVPGHHAAQQDR